MRQTMKQLRVSLTLNHSNGSQFLISFIFISSKTDKTPSISVFVGNLPVNTKRDKILKLFSKFGKVKSIRFRLSNGTKFFKSQSKVTSPNVIAFVDYDTVEDAQASLVLNGEKIKENVIRVNLQSNAKSADSFDGKRTVFVGNLKYCKYSSVSINASHYLISSLTNNIIYFQLLMIKPCMTYSRAAVKSNTPERCNVRKVAMALDTSVSRRMNQFLWHWS